jgi:hypothetical protein
LAPTSWGALIDRITILKIKQEYAPDAKQAAIIAREIDALCAVRNRHMPANADIDGLVEELSTTNRRLWESEDAIRRHGSRKDFGAGFVAIARTIYQENDRRSRIKATIDDKLASELVEIKIFENW